MDFVYFVVLVGVLIFVHELGHFAWAKFFGVKVLKFSLGFGPKLIGFQRGETEYVLAAFPLGGYVRMLGEHPHDSVSGQDAARSFHTQPLWKRIFIVLAGPSMNLVFPVVLYFVVFLGDTTLPPAVVGTVFPGHPADGKLLPGDRVVAINGHEVQTFYALTREVEHSAGKRLSLTVQRGDTRKRVTVVPAATRRERPLDLVDYVGRVGITPAQPAAVLGVMSPKAPAAVAQLKTFDVVIAAGGEPVRHFADVQKAFASNTGSLVPLTYLRPTRVTAALGGLVDMDIYEPHLAAVTPEPGAGTPDERGGIELADLYVNEVTVGSPEHRMGLRPGDRLLTLDGEPIRLWATFLGDLREGRGRLHSLSWRRAGAVHSGHFRLRHERGITEHGQPYDRYVVGIRNWLPASVEPPVPNPHPLSYAVVEAFRSTKEVVELTLFSVVRLLQGRLSVKSIGGPLTIFEVAGTAAREGALNYLTLMAFISINLGLINLLPIPMLDGGHLLFFVVEAVARRPLSVRIREYASIAGLSLLIALMILAFKNDIERQWPRIVDEVSGD